MKTETKNIPALRFPEFEDEWEIKNIEDCFVFKNGLNKEKEYFGKGTPIINFTDVFNKSALDSQNIFGLVTVSEQEKENYSAKKGDVFFTRTSETINEIGMAAVLIEEIEDCVFSGFVLRARPTNQSLIDSFKKYCFSIPPIRKEIVTKSSFTTRALTSGTLLNKVIFKFPKSKTEQQKIAAFLTAVDEKIQHLTKKKHLFGKYKKGVLQKIFNQEIRLKDDKGVDFANWEDNNLGNFLIHKSERNRDLKTKLVLSINNKKGFISQQEQFEDHIVASKDLSNYKIVTKNDYAYNPSRINVGSIARLKQFDSGIVSPMYIVFRTNGLLHNEFFDYLYQTHYFKHLIKVGCSGSVRDSLNYDDLCEFIVKIPSPPEQQKIANFLSAIDEKINLVNQQLEKTKDYKKGLLQKMFI